MRTAVTRRGVSTAQDGECSQHYDAQGRQAGFLMKMEKIKTLFRSFVRFPRDLLIKRISRQSRALVCGSSFSLDQLPVNPHCSLCTACPDLPSVQKQRSRSSFDSQEARSVSGAQEKASNSSSKRGDAEGWPYG